MLGHHVCPLPLARVCPRTVRMLVDHVPSVLKLVSALCPSQKNCFAEFGALVSLAQPSRLAHSSVMALSASTSRTAAGC
eukprot:1432014-Prymnesium_polylepis.1